MREMAITAEWQEAKAGLRMVDGRTYVIQFQGSLEAIIEAVDVEGGGPPARTDAPLLYFNRDTNPWQGDLEFTARAGWTWWLRTRRGGSKVVSAIV